MASQEFQSEAATWIIAGTEREPDEVQKELAAVALRVWPRAEAYARRELFERGLADETTMILQAWEDALQSVQRSLRRKLRLTRIHNLDSYVFGAFAHRLKRVLRKEKTLEFVPTNRELAKLRAAQDWDWVTDLENFIELKRVMTHMDDWMKEVLFRRSQAGHSWDRIARDFGITKNQAKLRFFDRLRKIREKIAERDRPV